MLLDGVARFAGDADDTLELFGGHFACDEPLQHDENFKRAALCKIGRGSERLGKAHFAERPFLIRANADDPGGFAFFVFVQNRRNGQCEDLRFAADGDFSGLAAVFLDGGHHFLPIVQVLAIHRHDDIVTANPGNRGWLTLVEVADERRVRWIAEEALGILHADSGDVQESGGALMIECNL